MDVKYVFLSGLLEEEVYMEQLHEGMKFRKENNVLKLNKALYGL